MATDLPAGQSSYFRRDSATQPVLTASMQSNISVQPYPIRPAFSHQRGLTLVELMIAMLLGLFLIGGLLQIFINSRQTNRMQEALSRLQENGRFAIDFIAQGYSHGGFSGLCSSRSTLFGTIPNIQDPPNPATDFLYDFNTAIAGLNATSAMHGLQLWSRMPKLTAHWRVARM